MCFDICTINIRVSIRVCGLHLVLFLSPALSGDEPLLSGARGAEKNVSLYVVFETLSYMSRLCRKPLRGFPPQSHCTCGFSVPIGI